MNTSTLRLAITILTVITALVHLGLAIVLTGNMQVMFILNGIGFLVLLYLLLRPPAGIAGLRNLVHYALIAFASVTIIGYFVVNGFKPDDYLGLFTKLVEILLVVTVFMHLRRTS
jgi:4-amino-4-deoxy-L-arabinose transferase-like glycosyltransferase